MSPMKTSANDKVVEYSFAVEYNGPPLTYDLPRAVPINVDNIPVAAVVALVPLSNKLSMPVVQPIIAQEARPVKVSKDKNVGIGSESMVSLTSVIAFDHNNEKGSDCSSKTIESGTGRTVSPTSVIAFDDRAGQIRDCELSGELCSSGALEFLNGQYASGESSEVGSSSRLLGSSSVSYEQSRELERASGSTSAVEFSGSFGNSGRGLSRLRGSSGGKGSLDFNDLNQQDWTSSESTLSFEYPSSRVSSNKNLECKDEADCDVRRPQVVTFCNIDSDDGLDETDSEEEVETRPVKKGPRTKGKKGTCYRCFKGNRFTEKEVCIVCDAKYCNSCVLRAMGSMPEGRKCVTCIGYPIDEAKRGNLGKCSRMLKRLLNDLEVRQIMKAEKYCEVNKLPPEYICVNSKHLSHEELVLLENCSNPPKKLKPGKYWYDKVSGLWGKEGQKPSQIISPHLNVGGSIKADASNGNTQVFINGREITKVELRMLQLAGVQCAGNPHFWVNEDGSYQEEGQKNTRGYIWGKAGMKLVCAFLALPVPSRPSNTCGEQSSSLFSRNVPDYLEQRILQKLLLVGYSGSGTSTIFKQAKILYKDTPFTEDERETIKMTIQSHVYGYLGILLEGRERFEEENLNDLKEKQQSGAPELTGDKAEDSVQTTYSIGSRLKALSDWLLKAMVLGNLEAIFPAATREYSPLIEELWNDPAIQATYKRRNELETLPDVGSYFLERAVEILRTDYEPSDLDVLYAEGVTSCCGLASVEFSFPNSGNDDSVNAAEQDSSCRYQLIRIHSRGLGENCKWLEMFDDVSLVIFCVALSDFDQFSNDGNGGYTNKMILSKKLFETIVTHPTFDQMDFLLILNKFDSFEKKIEHVPLTMCEWFNDFLPVISHNRPGGNSNNSHNPTLGQLAFHYVAVKFKRLYSSLTGRKLYVSMVKGLEPDSVDAALKYAREILKWDLEKPCFSFGEYSIYSTEDSSHSH